MMWKRLYICQRDIHYTPRCISLLYTLLWDLYAHERTIRCIYGYENSALLRRRVYFNFIMVVSSGTVKHESNRSPSAPRSSFTHHFAVLLLLPVDEYFGPLVSICVCDVCVHLTKINAFDYIRWCTMFRFQRFLFVFVFFLFSFSSGDSPFFTATFIKAAILHTSYHVHWLVMNRNITIRRNSLNKKPPNSPSCISFLWHFIGRYFFYYAKAYKNGG